MSKNRPLQSCQFCLTEQSEVTRTQEQNITLNHETLRSQILYLPFQEKERSNPSFTPRHRIPQESDSRRGIFRLSFTNFLRAKGIGAARKKPIIIRARDNIREVCRPREVD